MTEAYALHEGAFGRAIAFELTASLVAHAHSETQLAFWLAGSQTEAHVGDQVVHYSEDTALGVNAYESHDAVLLDPGRSSVFLAFMVSKPWLEARRQESGKSFRFASPSVSISPSMRQAAWRVLDVILGSDGTRIEVDIEVERLLAAAVDASQHGDVSSRHLPNMLDPRLRIALQYMRDHCAEKVNVEDVAERVGLSRAMVFALFRDQLNTTPQVFHSALRVEEAMRRVSEGEPLTELALELGFSAPGNFSRFFKEHTGVSPSGFRRASAPRRGTSLTGVI